MEVTHCFYIPGALSIQDVAIQRDGAWFGGYSEESEEAMKVRTGAVLTVFDEAWEAVKAAQRETLVKPPQSCTEEVFMRALNVLPPCRWQRHLGVEFFHVSERITGDLVDWYGRIGESYCTFVESDRLPSVEVVKLVAMGVKG